LELVVLATRNPGKARELAALLVGVARRFESLADRPGVALPPEEAPTYRDNALAKARAVQAALGVPALGDDSGLEVDFLAGAPGVRSARFAGTGARDADNNRRLLTELTGVPETRRTARFRCVLAFVRSTGDEIVVEGTCEGRILEEPRGEHGFGYDPLFLPDGGSCSFAELPADTKNRISHRARAAAELRAALRAALAD
jgi:XTP/dITP diphosphohydrolase